VAEAEPALRGYRDRDYLLTGESFFCVVGGVHPRDRVIAYVKYVPSPDGRWGRGERRFRRALPYYTMADLLETFRLLEAHPQYLYHSPVLNVTMSAVPVDRIKAHLRPEEKMRQLIGDEALDPLQRKVVDLVKTLSDESGVSTDLFGVTGSVLLDIHREFSDIDLTVYGVKNVPPVREALLRLYERPDSAVRRLDEKTLREWCADKMRRRPLTYAEAAAIGRRKWGMGLFRETFFSVHPVKLDAEVTERYGDKLYRPEGIVKVEATVSEDAEAGFLPAVYGVEDERSLEGPTVEDIREVVSYESLYGDVASVNERIVARGKLERVHDTKRGDEYHRVLVGSPEARGNDYIKLAAVP